VRFDVSSLGISTWEKNVGWRWRWLSLGMLRRVLVVWCKLTDVSEVSNSGGFGRNLASVAVKMFSHLIYFINTLYKFCSFNAICKDNAAINCITIHQKKKVHPVKFDGSKAETRKLLSTFDKHILKTFICHTIKFYKQLHLLAETGSFNFQEPVSSSTIR
jgi:hypothetical protein